MYKTLTELDLWLWLCQCQNNQLMSVIWIMCSKLRPSMMQHLLRRLVFDVPLLNEHTKMPLKVTIQKFFFQMNICNVYIFTLT